MAWERAIKEHLSLWRFVRQEHEEFARDDNGSWISMDVAGEWENFFIIRGAVGDTPDFIKQKAEDFASMADAFLINIGVDRKQGVSEEQAIAELTLGFAFPDSKLKSMGDIMTACYVVTID